MSRRRLTNTFGFPSLCFVCDPENGGGMHVSFFLDDDAGAVVAEYVPPAEHSGAPTYAHGGAIMAVLDDAMAWAIIALKERFGVTRRSETEFKRPVKVGEQHAVTAWVESWEDRALVARAELRDAAGKVCAAARATYVVLTLDEARAAIGAEPASTATYTEPLS